MWMVSVLFFLMMFLMVYSYMPEQVGLSIDDKGEILNKISRENFFYISLGVFVVSNLGLYALSRLLEMMPRGGSSLLSNTTAVIKLNNWVISFSLALNICYILLITFLGMFNNLSSFRFADYTIILIYLIPVIILLWLMVLAFLLLKRS